MHSRLLLRGLQVGALLLRRSCCEIAGHCIGYSDSPPTWRAGVAARMSTHLQRSSQEEARLRDEELDYERFMASGLGSLDAADDEQEVRRLCWVVWIRLGGLKGQWG